MIRHDNLDFIRDILYPLLWAVLISMFFRVFVLAPVAVSGNSMNNTLQDGDLLFVDRLTPTLKRNMKLLDKGDDPVFNYKDVIVFHNPKDPSEYFIKRVIGVPGDTVRFLSGGVYINGELLIEDYVNTELTYTYHGDIWHVGTGEYFVMGDNRLPGESMDSRYFGSVDEKDIIGKIVGLR